MSQTWRVSTCEFWSRLWLPRAAPLQSVTSVKYYDAANVERTASSSLYARVANTEPACLSLVAGQTWPALWDRDDAVTVEYVTGATEPANVPAPLRQAVLLLVGHWYANRESVVVGTISGPVAQTVTTLCAPYRLFEMPPEWA